MLAASGVCSAAYCLDGAGLIRDSAQLLGQCCPPWQQILNHFCTCNRSSLPSPCIVVEMLQGAIDKGLGQACCHMGPQPHRALQSRG